MATTVPCVLGSVNSDSPTRPASCPPQQSGGRARPLCHRRHGRAVAGRRNGCTVMRRIEPVSAKQLAVELAADAWQPITWREGSNTPLSSRFARLRVRPAHDESKRNKPAAEEWLF